MKHNLESGVKKKSIVAQEKISLLWTVVELDGRC
jgi:hypothetical protein